MTTETPPVDAAAADAARPQKKRRPTRSLRRSLAIRLTAVALLAVLLLGGFVFFEARELLTDSVETQLTNQQQSQARSVANGLDFLTDSVAVIARDEGTVQALSDFATAFAELENDALSLIGYDEAQALDDYYATTVAEAIDDAGLDLPPAAALVPGEPAARYLQYHYIVANPYGRGDRDQLVSIPGEDTAYQTAHTGHHPTLDRQRTLLGFADLLLLDGDGNIVYTAEKRADLGRRIQDDPALGEGIPTAITQQLSAAALGEPVLIDFEQYPPALGAPTLFVAAAVAGPGGAIGAVVVEIPVESLNRLTTSRGQWEQVGLGETGEVYVVGRDLLMRSDSRLWLESPDAYLARLQEEGQEDVAESVELFGTTVLYQPVDGDAVETAFDGEYFVGRSRDYLDRDTLTVAGRIDNDQLDWVLVAQIDRDEAGRALDAYILRLLITGAILVLLVVAAGLAFAHLFTRPFRPVVAAADTIAEGDLDVKVPDLGKNELGDVAQRLSELAAHLRTQETALAEEERKTQRLLLSALPPRLVEQLRAGEARVDDLVDTATVVAVTVSGLVESPSIDADTAVEFSARLSRDLESAAYPLGLERVRSSSDQHMFVAGLGRPETDADQAADFALQVRSVLGAFAEETGIEPGYQIGVCSGRVISGLLSSDQLAYGVFGKPAQTALALCTVAAPSQILVDRHTAAELHGDWETAAVVDLVDLRGDAIEAVELAAGPGRPSGEGDDEGGPGRERA